ncbi:hypothetical protein DNK47_01015 [Mycoplasma wenyonii]|uniref:Uncharacterized protein n=1 Tax=Mycoplasma wenyonii TaxID=65123 RepID=A0A328PK23_9MOLU|nr:hypothetical protein [Mycoplasma wenyonii]RAO95192.1 hypothetical protein DNK47_01015 [Mycoplasma wenyonii]
MADWVDVLPELDPLEDKKETVEHIKRKNSIANGSKKNTCNSHKLNLDLLKGGALFSLSNMGKN